ncbi:hypothetical protein [Campylobacter insulaenigrae]|uniref:hypothetical protein n=1 Tax=Campylobacter insulaenigrae TaxID=260714 RepID=UPI0021539385|nr:hypothetical protein [Campylobacter insulaenigrae]MCR6572998.1 hypothetical protein [Campylobacter insulaenigrae]MCR6581573.1 hypothetical protein [Campylobacter insulaenigrae]
MSKPTHIIEANELARACLKTDLKHSLKEARIIYSAEERMLCFYFDNPFAIALFEKNKEVIKNDLRIEYKKKIEFYKRIDFVFYDICSKNTKELSSRTTEERQRLQKGLDMLENIIKRSKNGKYE